jgi:DNA recombination protein RmuC
VIDDLVLAAIAALACAACGIAAWWIARIQARAAHSETRLAAERDLAAAAERAAGLERRATDLDARLQAVDAARARVAAELAATQARAAQLEATLAHEREAAAEKLAVHAAAQAQLTEAFKALSSDALKSNNTAFLELARETFGRLHQQSTGDLDKRQQAIDAMVKPIRDSLEKVDGRIAEIEKVRLSAWSALGEQLKSLALAQSTLQTETTRLATALTGTRTAGTWGELQLRRVVELAGMVEHCDFSEQEVSGGQRPDLVVRLPRGQVIAVDAKAPTDAFRIAAAAATPEARATGLAEHASKVRGHIDALAARAYWEQFAPSPEFVVLFLPGDQFLAAALEADPTLVDRGIRSRVLLATPSTLVALLKAAAYGWRQESISRNAEDVARIGRDLYDRIAGFADHLERSGRGLEQAVKNFNAAVGSFEQTLLPGARRFAELGAAGKKQIPEIEPVDTAPRDIAKRA